MKTVSPKLILFFGVLCASLSSIFVRYSEAPSLVIATYRLCLTVLILTPIILKKHLDEIKKLCLKDILACFVSGIFLALHFTLFFESLNHTTITSSTALVSTEVIFTSIGFLFILKGKIHKIGIISIIITFMGSIVIAMGDNGVGGNAILGDICAIFAAVFVAGYTLIGRVKRGHMSTNVYTFLVYCGCVITLIVFDFITGTPIFGYNIKELFIGLGLAVFCTLMGHSIFSWSLKYISPSYVSAAKLCEPVFATAMGMLLFSEIPRIGQFIGAVIIIVGVYFYSTVEKEQSTKDKENLAVENKKLMDES